MSTVRLTIDGRGVEADPGETLLHIAASGGIELPHLCTLDRPGYRAGGNCRSCVVEIRGERLLAPACLRHPTDGMVVETASDRARSARRTVLQLLGAYAATDPLTRNDELRAAMTSSAPSPYAPLREAELDASHPAMRVDLSACITCARCVEACRDVQVNDVIGIAGRGHQARIVFDFADPMGASSCVGCGECVEACPTGALSLADRASVTVPDRAVGAVCSYCGVGCQLTYLVNDDKITSVVGRDGPANHSRLCVKGRFGYDFVRHPARLLTPLIRLDGVPKRADDIVDPLRPETHFRAATWDEALERAIGGFRKIRDRDGGSALAGFGSAKGTNEEAYLFQKLVRTGFGTNNVDHCTRLCHSSSVTALFEGLSSAAVSNPVADVAQADVIMVVGANPAVNHPVAATWMKNAVRRGAKLIVIDPRGQALSRFATHMLAFTPGTDVALFNAIMNVIVAEGLSADRFIDERTNGGQVLRDNVMAYPPEAVASICGVSAETIRDVARLYASARTAMIFWGMGVSQHVHGTDNARCLIALALLCGQIGRPGTGLHPLRGQNNVQGASDAGLVPMFLPGYQRTEDAGSRHRLEALWGHAIQPARGLTVVEIVDAALDHRIRGLYVVGENPAMSDPDLHHARAALAELEHLVVEDLFLTETAFFADVVLPATAAPEKTGTFTNTDRRVQLTKAAIPAPGEARADWWTIQEVARGMGLSWNYEHPRDIYEEMRQALDPPFLAGAPWDRLVLEGAVTYPVRHTDTKGDDVLFESSFPTTDGRANFVSAGWLPPNEVPDAEYPMVLSTGRLLEHWHTGAMTRRSRALDAIEPAPAIHLAPADLARLGLADGASVRLDTRRGSVTAAARADGDIPVGMVFLPFHFSEAAANLLTNAALDPYAKIPEYKFCAARVSPA